MVWACPAGALIRRDHRRTPILGTRAIAAAHHDLRLLHRIHTFRSSLLPSSGLTKPPAVMTVSPNLERIGDASELSS
jgi:hypothetical protein